ncbi:MAG: hypothetical protein ABTD50_06400 [Polyangiaceae bacterium]
MLPRAVSNNAIDLTLAKPRFPSTLERWYVDVLLDDGTVVLVYLGRLQVLGASWARATAEIFFSDGRIVRGSSAVTKPAGEPGCVRFGNTAIEGKVLKISAGDVHGELRYRARAAAHCPRTPWLAVGSRTLTWSVEVPDADVEGRLSWPMGRLDVTGRGYRDRVHFDRAARGGPVAGVDRRLGTVDGFASESVDGRPASDAARGAPVHSVKRGLSVRVASGATSSRR